MPTWFLCFIAGLALVCFTATPRDRMAALFVALNVCLGLALLYLFQCCQAGYWRLAIYATVETATAGALLWWAPGRTGRWQAACHAAAVGLQLLCWVDLESGTAVVYDTYEALYALVSAAQLAGFHDTLLTLLRRLVAALALPRDFGRRALCRRRGRLALFRHPSHPRL